MDLLDQVVAEKKLKVVVRNLLRQTSYSVEEIAKLAEVTEDFVREVKKNLRKKR